MSKKWKCSKKKTRCWRRGCRDGPRRGVGIVEGWSMVERWLVEGRNTKPCPKYPIVPPRHTFQRPNLAHALRMCQWGTTKKGRELLWTRVAVIKGFCKEKSFLALPWPKLQIVRVRWHWTSATREPFSMMAVQVVSSKAQPPSDSHTIDRGPRHVTVIPRAQMTTPWSRRDRSIARGITIISNQGQWLLQAHIEIW